MTEKRTFEKIYRKDIADIYSEQEGITKIEAEKRIDDICEIIVKALVGGKSVMLSNFFNFKLTERKAKKCVNPKTKEEMIIPKVVTIVTSMTKSVKERLQNNLK